MNHTESEIHQIQIISTALLSASARGEIDLNKLAKQELANRGQDANGKWVGFKEAARIHNVD